jgi:hypothetical protein
LDDFAEKQLDAHSTPHGNNLVDLSTPKIGYRRQSTGTKGYVNRFQ